ncbi:MAG: hypothetical protein IPN38_07360 [Flavobacteriales bacterium]|nr:hypothetical protein [Flavobacteriales bacterium]
MKTELGNYFVENTAGMDGEPSIWVAGASYGNSRWDLAATFSGQTNGDFSTVLDTSGIALQSVVYDGTGAEAYIRFKHKAWAFSGGFNYYLPTFDENEGLAKDFTLQYVVLGAEYHPGRYAYLYAEGRLDDSITANGLDGLDVLTVGLRIDVDRLYTRKFVHEPWKW